MSMQETIATQARRVLTQLVSDTVARVPSTRGSVSENLVRGVPTVCASFLKSLEADTVDLCVEIETVDGCVSVSADLVRGGSGEIFSEMTTVLIRKDMDMKAAVRTLEEYVRDQADAISAELR